MKIITQQVTADELRRMTAATFGHFVAFDSMINMRPSQGNRSRGVESPQTREKILQVVAKRIQR